MNCTSVFTYRNYHHPQNTPEYLPFMFMLQQRQHRPTHGLHVDGTSEGPSCKVADMVPCTDLLLCDSLQWQWWCVLQVPYSAPRSPAPQSSAPKISSYGSFWKDNRKGWIIPEGTGVAILLLAVNWVNTPLQGRNGGYTSVSHSDK